MPKLNESKLSKKQLEEKLTNRVLINLGIGFGCYALLYVLYYTFAANVKNIMAYPYVMLGLLVAFAAFTVLFYVFSNKGKTKYKNYAHMFLAFSIACIYLNFARISLWLGISAFVPSILKNTKSSFIYLSIALAVYLVVVIVYNSVILYKTPKKAVAKTPKSK